MRQQLSPDFAMEYEDIGRGDAVVLLHAFPLARGMWQPQLQALQKDFRIIAPDMRGFGGTSPFGGPPSIDQMAADVVQLLDSLKLPRVVLGGLSMGGYVALAFARRFSDRLRGLILADTRAEADSAEAKANRDKMIAFMQEHSAAELFEQLLPKLVSEATRQNQPAVLSELRRIASAQTPAGIIGALKSLRDRADSTDLLPALRVPTLVIVGSEDALTPPNLAEGMKAKLPNARLVQIAGAGHLSNLENPDAFNEAVKGFVKSLK
jgi:pimeloyl-ACP methyl ester carboxylesterase